MDAVAFRSSLKSRTVRTDIRPKSSDVQHESKRIHSPADWKQYEEGYQPLSGIERSDAMAFLRWSEVRRKKRREITWGAGWPVCSSRVSPKFYPRRK